VCRPGLIFIACLLYLNAQAQEIPKWKIGELETYIQKTSTPTVINFWATFCKPCIGEIPYFQKLVSQYDKDSVKLLLVSLDMSEMYPEQINEFAGKFNFTAPIAFLDETNADVFCPKIDSGWSGAIPATLFINNKTGYRKFSEGTIPEQAFETELKRLVAVKEDEKPRYLLLLVGGIVVILIIFLYYNRRTAKS
jgi:thiol-disulfide isomerase/thioredoxin